MRAPTLQARLNKILTPSEQEAVKNLNLSYYLGQHQWSADWGEGGGFYRMTHTKNARKKLIATLDILEQYPESTVTTWLRRKK